MKLINRVASIFDGTLGLLAGVAAILVIGIMLGITAEVIARYALNTSIWGMQEVTEYFLLFITFLATAYVLRKGRHVRMDLVLTRLKPGTQTVINTITSIIGAIMCFLLAWYGARVTWQNFLDGHYFITELEPPKFIILFVIPLGLLLLSIQFLRNTYGYLRGWRSPSDKEQRSLVEQ